MISFANILYTCYAHFLQKQEKLLNILSKYNLHQISHETNKNLQQVLYAVPHLRENLYFTKTKETWKIAKKGT